MEVRDFNVIWMDEIDKKILNILRRNSRTPYREMARETRISDVAVHKRIKKLSGVIKAYTVLVDQAAMGKKTTALVNIKCEAGRTEEIARKLTKIEDVVEVYTTIGEYDIIAKIRTANTESLKNIIEKEMGRIRGLNEVRTSIVFRPLKENVSLVM